MICDGWGFNHIEAASYYQYGQTGSQFYDNFPVSYALSTYSASSEGYHPELAWSSFDYVLRKPTDSAAAASALATGVKIFNGAISVDTLKKPIETIVQRLEKLGKATGVVTTVQLSHATPAAFVAHNERRSSYEEIAQEMILKGSLEVIMGAGHPFYNENGQLSGDSSFKFVGGLKTWQALAQGNAGADADGDGIADHWTLIQDRADFQALSAGPTPKRVIGIPRVSSTLQAKRRGDVHAEPFTEPLIETVPTLTEMTLAALNLLDNDPDGFFLMIEGGAIDWLSHDNQSGRMIEEMVDFNHCVEAVVRWVELHSGWDETLVIITGDHECGYLTGPGSGKPDSTSTHNVQEIWRPIENRGQGNLPGMEWHSDGHTNSLIPFFAHGKGSELFHPVADETDPVRGKYLDNTEISQVLFSLFPVKRSKVY